MGVAGFVWFARLSTLLVRILLDRANERLVDWLIALRPTPDLKGKGVSSKLAAGWGGVLETCCCFLQ